MDTMDDTMDAMDDTMDALQAMDDSTNLLEGLRLVVVVRDLPFGVAKPRPESFSGANFEQELQKIQILKIQILQILQKAK
jgi:hypothetical protein